MKVFEIRFALGQCRSRNETEAAGIGRVCRQSCESEGAFCRKQRICQCDHECGLACVNPGKPKNKMEKKKRYNNAIAFLSGEIDCFVRIEKIIILFQRRTFFQFKL